MILSDNIYELYDFMYSKIQEDLNCNNNFDGNLLIKLYKLNKESTKLYMVLKRLKCYG